MLTKETDFTGLYHVPNATDQAPLSNLLGNKTLIGTYITQYENESMDILLGIELADLLRVEIVKKPFDPLHSDTADQIWIDLVNGKDEYRGLGEAFIAYIFYRFYEDDQSQYVGIGEKKIESEVLAQAELSKRATRVWRRYFELTIGSSRDKTVVIRNVGIGIIYGGLDSPYHSLYTFLKAKLTTYPTWKPNYFENINQYGI